MTKALVLGIDIDGTKLDAASASAAVDRPIGLAAPHTIGIGIPGQADPVDGSVRTAVNLGIDGEAFPLAAMIEQHFGLLDAIRANIRDRVQASPLAIQLLAPGRIVSLPADEPVGAIGAAALARRRLVEWTRRVEGNNPNTGGEI